MEPEWFEEETDGEELKHFRTRVFRTCILVSALITTGLTGRAEKGCDDVYKQSENKDLNSEELHKESPIGDTAGER